MAMRGDSDTWINIIPVMARTYLDVCCIWLKENCLSIIKGDFYCNFMIKTHTMTIVFIAMSVLNVSFRIQVSRFF